jgi:glycosyltransferase involved in cell wall biosynthesis
MKKVLILTYYFPPLGLGGTQRIAKFVKYLPACGWEPTIVTVKPIVYWALDSSLQADVNNARVIRTESFDPQRLLARLGKTAIHASDGEKKSGLLSTINQKVLPFVLVPDSKVLWHSFAFKAIKKLLADEHFETLLTTSPPHSVHLLGQKVAQKFKLPWVADFRDGWAGSHIVYEPTRWQFMRNQKLQQRVVQRASAIVSASPGIDESLKVHSDETEKFRVITNGFDPEDFPATINKNKKYTLCYSGTINRFADPEPFLDALVLLRQTNPELIANLHVEFVGMDTLGGFENLVHKRGLADVVSVLGQQDHVNSVKHLKNADALLLIAKARETDTFIPGKTFEYIGAGKPVFCISTSRFTNELLKDYEPAQTVTSFEPKKIYIALQEFLNTNWDLSSIDLGFVQQFNRKHQTEKLAEILNTLI